MKKRGRGIACCWYGIARTAAMDRAAAWVELDDGGTVKVTTGVTEIGEGILTVLAQIAADVMGVNPEDVTIGDNDTSRAPEAAHAGATRQTYMIGNAVAAACREARARFQHEMAQHWEVSADDIEARDRRVYVKGTDLGMAMDEAVHMLKHKRGVVIVGAASFTSPRTPFDPNDGRGTPWQSYVYGTQIAEVDVDTETGEVQVLGIWAAHDVGRAVNPQGVEAQIEGGVVMGLGHALMEDFQLKDGRTTTPGFAKYILPTSLDVPHVTSIIVEDIDPKTPLGVKGIGEPSMVPTAPAIINAIYDAVGVRITSLPASPERVLEALALKRAALQPA
jgi:CO/xanthine dehydrogenase Mo-binding subunit